MSKYLSLLTFGVVLAGVLSESPCWAQVEGVNPTNINLVGNQFNIRDGQIVGRNQFHSFIRFGLTSVQIANFETNPVIQNILGRVTGREPSIIDGTIRITGGNPNLYLMNPSGFVFGKDAILSVPASFTATTASAIAIGDEWFNAADNAYPTSTEQPGGLAFTMAQPGAIIIDRANLTVTPGNSLSLVAGSVSSSGALSAPGGQLTIAAVPGSSLVRINQQGSPLGLVFDSLSSLTNQPAGISFEPTDIPRLLTLGNVTLPADTTFGVGTISTNQDLSTSNGINNGGNITLTAQKGITARNIFSFSGLTNTTSGDAGNITITTKRGNIKAEAIQAYSGGDRGLLETDIGNAGNGGNISVIAEQGNIELAELMSYSGTLEDGTDRINLAQKGGNISLTAPSGSISVLGNIWSASRAFSNAPLGSISIAGDGGRIDINALNDMNINVTGGNIRSFSGSLGSTSNAGDVTLVSQRGNISTGLIEAYSLASGNSGNGGNITIFAPTGNITSSYLHSYSQAPQVSGKGGSISLIAGINNGNITLRRLFDGESTTIFSYSKATGQSGNISLSAATINISLSSKILAADSVENGGSISLNASRGILFTGSPNPLEPSIETSGNNIFINGAVDGNIDLWMRASKGNITINGDLGKITPLRNFRATNSSELRIAGSINLADGVAQEYDTRVTLTGNTSFGNDRTPSVTFKEPVTIDNNSLTITAEKVNFKEPITGTGNILLQPPPGKTIEIGNSIPQTFFNIPAGSSSGLVTVGRPDNSNNVIFVGAASFNTPLNIRANTISHTNSTLSGTAPLTLTANQISVGNIINPGQPIALISQRNLTTGNLDTSAPTAQTGAINLRSDRGSIVTGTLNSSGSSGNNITILARTAVTTGSINTSGSQGSGGNLLIDPIGDVQIGSINTQGGNLGSGGNIRIVAGQLFRATETFTDRNNTLASISAAGGQGGGRIEIFHGGGSRNIRFNVGDATTNGTAGAITNGINSILPPRSFLGSFRIGDIRIVTTNPQTQCDISSCPTSKPNVPPRDQSKRDNTAFLNSLPDKGIERTFLDYLGEIPNKPTSASPIDIQRKLRAIKAETNNAVKPAIFYLTFVSANTPTDKTAWLQSLVDHDPQYQQVLWKFDSSGNAINYITEQQPQENQTPQDNDQLEIIILTTNDSIIRKRVPDATRKELKRLTNLFLNSIRDITVDEAKIKEHGNKLYEYLIAPVSAELNTQGINNLTFITDMGLRGIPFSALHNSTTDQYLVQQYSVGLMPSFSLTNTDYKPIKNAQLLAMGTSTFLNDTDLPYAKLGVEVITQMWNAQPPLLDEKFTPENLTLSRLNIPYGIVHLATHANFKADALKESSITFSNRKIGLHEVSEMQLNNPPTNLLVLVACHTAIPDRSAELGFAGIAAKTGASSVVATLWGVEQTASFGLTTKFYDELKKAPVKVQALQNAQRALLNGEVYIDDKGMLQGLDNNISVETAAIQKQLEEKGQFNKNLFKNRFRHPHFWAGFTLIGNPW